MCVCVWGGGGRGQEMGADKMSLEFGLIKLVYYRAVSEDKRSQEMGAGKMCLEFGLVIKLVGRRVVPEDLPGGDKRFQGVGERGRLCLSPHRHHWEWFCMEMGSGGNRFNIPLTVEGQSQDGRPQTTIFLKREDGQNGIEPKSLPALPLGQAGWQNVFVEGWEAL